MNFSLLFSILFFLFSSNTYLINGLSIASILNGQLISVTNPSLNEECFNYQLTIGSSGVLNLTKIILQIPCVNLCSLSSSSLLSSLPLSVVGTVASEALSLVGTLGSDATTGLCGIITEVNSAIPLNVVTGNKINIETCINLSTVSSLLSGFGLFNGLLGSILGTLNTYINNVLAYATSVMVPNLCPLAL